MESRGLGVPSHRSVERAGRGVPHRNAASSSPDIHALVERNLWAWQEPFELDKLELPPLHSQMTELPPVELERQVVGGRKVRCVWNEHDLPVGLGAFLLI